MEKLTLKTIFKALANINAGNAEIGKPSYELKPLLFRRKVTENGTLIYSYGAKPVCFLNDLIDRLRDVLRDDEIEKLLSLKYDTDLQEMPSGLQRFFFAIYETNPKFTISLRLNMVRKGNEEC